MKRIVYAPAALASLEDIFAWTLDHFGDAQAEKYTQQLIQRLNALATGEPPHARPCAVLLRGRKDVEGLGFYREGRHVLILRETADTLELVEVFHEKMNIEAWLMEI